MRTHTSSIRFKLPVCSTCNGALDARFEHPAKPVLRRFLLNTEVIAGREAETAGLWFVKTWLLLAHPQLVPSDPGWPLRPWEPFETHLYDWMVSGDPPPGHVTAWLIKVDPVRQSPTKRHLPLPTVVADNQTFAFKVQQFGLGAIEVQLAHHPGWSFDHPLEAEGRALRVWPPSGVQLDIGALPSVPANDVRWLKGPLLRFKPGTYWTRQRAPLSISTDLFSDFMSETSGIIEMRV